MFFKSNMYQQNKESDSSWMG